MRLANLYRQTGRHQETEEAGKEALAIRKKLAEAHPRLPQYQHELAHAYDTLGLFYSALRRTERAEACFQEALAIWKKLAEAHPEVLSYHGQLAQVYYTLGDCPSNDCRLFYQEGEPAEQGQRELAETVVCSERQVR